MFRLRRNINLDNNATTAVSPPVAREMYRILSKVYGNPSSLYRLGQEAALLMEDSRATIATAIGANADEVIFTGSASEANNTILKGIAEISLPARSAVVSSPVEHPSVMGALEYLGRKGIKIRYTSVDRWGRVDPEEMGHLIDNNVILVCCMLANNELGTIQDVATIARYAHQHGALIFSDCVQALGKIPVNVRSLGLDFAAFSAHKVHGPKGIGALFVSRGLQFAPLIHGGGQETGHRAGTESLHNVAGFAVAANGIPGLHRKADTLLRLRNLLRERLENLPSSVEILSPREGCLPNTLSVRFPGFQNAFVMAALDSAGIAVSAGSACHAQENEPSHVLTAAGRSPGDARETIRISLSTSTTEREIQFTLRTIEDILAKRVPPINIVPADHVNESVWEDPNVFIVDVRFPHDRVFAPDIPRAHKMSLIHIRRMYHIIPRDKRILIVCQAGLVSPFVAMYLRRKGYTDVGILGGGIVAWRMSQSGLRSRDTLKDAARLNAK